MNSKTLRFATLLCAISSSAFATPLVSVTPGGIQSGNWVWDVSVTPDLDLVPDHSGTPVAVELGFRLISDPLVSVNNTNPGEFDTNNPGKTIFGWEVPYSSSNNKPEGIEVNCAACTISNPTGGAHNATIVNGTTNEIFAAMGSINFITPGAKSFLRITALGPGNGGPLSSRIDWLGVYGIGNSQGQLSQVNGIFGGSYTVGNYFFSGSATQTVPEPASAALIATIACGLLSVRPPRRGDRFVKH